MPHELFRFAGIFAAVFAAAFVVFYSAGFFSNTVMFAAIGPPFGSMLPQTIGPSAEEQACMRACVVEMGCTVGDVACMQQGGKSQICLGKCNISKPKEETPEISCMQACVEKGCGPVDFECQNRNKDSCEKECGMVKEPPAKNKEEQCIRDCIKKISPGTICSAGPEGEIGNDACQQCSAQCVHLYEGPCLDDAKLKARQKACETCEHCYGVPVMGDSGEGWQCMVDVECKDATSEWGDDPGSGPEVSKNQGQETADAGGQSAGTDRQEQKSNTDNVIGDIARAIGSFFSGLLGQ